MKHRELEAHLREHGCAAVREGGAHTVYRNAASGSIAAVPRHNEIKMPTVQRICRALGIPMPARR